MGDTSIGQQFVQYAGGTTPGDEGQAYRLVCQLQQQTFLNVTTITAVPPSNTINTTTTQIVSKSKDAQTVTVASTTGLTGDSAKDWVIVEQAAPALDTNIEAVQVTSFGPSSITGIFRNNHLSGVTVKPALRLVCASTYQMGQDRILVNMSGASYSTGTVSSISGGGFTGTGTAWANNMVGGNATDIGAITLAADDVTGSPFDAGANRLRSWYQINPVASATSLGIVSSSVAGDSSYRGKGPIRRFGCSGLDLRHSSLR